MKLQLVNITDPRRVKLVTDILNEIEGVEVRRAPKEVKVPMRRVTKVPSAGRNTVKPMTPKEQKFVKRLTRAFRDMDDHIAGKKKLKTLKEVLDEH